MTNMTCFVKIQTEQTREIHVTRLLGLTTGFVCAALCVCKNMWNLAGQKKKNVWNYFGISCVWFCLRFPYFALRAEKQH